MTAISCPPLLSPEVFNCSGRGECLSLTECRCMDGWTGLGDFAYKSPSCDVNILAVKILWILLGLTHFMQMCIVIYLFLVRFVRGTNSAITIKSQQKQQMVTIAVVVTMVFANLLFISLSIGRAVHTETKTIGTDALATSLFSLASAVFWAMLHLFLYSFLVVIQHQAMIFQKRTTWMIGRKRMIVTLVASALSAMISSLMPLGMLYASSSEEFFVYGSAHYFGIGATCFVTGLIVLPIFIFHLKKEIIRGQNAVIDSLNGRLKASFDALLYRLTLFHREMTKQILMQTIFALMFGAWPFIQVHGSSYFLPIAWISGAIGGFLVLYLTFPPPIPLESQQQQTTTDDVDHSDAATCHMNAGGDDHSTISNRKQQTACWPLQLGRSQQPHNKNNHVVAFSSKE